MREPNNFRKNEITLPWTWRFLSVKEFQRHLSKTLKRKEDSSQFPFRRVAVSLRCRSISRNVTSFWNFNQIPFRGMLILTKRKIKRLRAFASRLGATHPCPIAVHTEPFSTSVFKDSTWIVATSTKICTRRRSMRAHALALLHLTPTPPYSRIYTVKILDVV